MNENANTHSKKISRRDALKLLAAAAGATALANLPARWSKPDLDVGVLPAHAQTSLPAHTVSAGASVPDANFCFSFDSTAVISPVASGIPLRYTISAGTVVITNPPSLTGTINTNAAGSVSLTIQVDDTSFTNGSVVTVVWSFVNPSDGSNSSPQSFTSAGSGC